MAAVHFGFLSIRLGPVLIAPNESSGPSDKCWRAEAECCFSQLDSSADDLLGLCKKVVVQREEKTRCSREGTKNLFTESVRKRGWGGGEWGVPP